MPVVRVNFNVYDAGEDFLNRLEREATRNLQGFLTLLSSYWRSTIDGSNYTREIKAISTEIARVRLLLEDSRTDTYYNQTRPEFLYQVLTSVMFPQGNAPNPNLPDLEFRQFLINILNSYYRGSIPSSIQDVVNLFVDGRARLVENFLEARKPTSGFDISDQFTFDIDVLLDNLDDIDIFLADKNIRLMLNIIRPAHTLYRIKYILQDEWIGQKNPDLNIGSKIIDQLRVDLFQYDYEDFRKFCCGVDGVDRLGVKKPIDVIGENHSLEF
jgi:hypothetical protein